MGSKSKDTRPKFQIPNSKPKETARGDGDDVRLLPSGRFPDGEEVVAVSMEVYYMQQCDQHRDELQELRVNTDDAGGGTYYVLKTKRWAVDGPEELAKVLNDFKRRFGGGYEGLKDNEDCNDC